MKSKRQFYLLCFIAIGAVLAVLLFAAGNAFSGLRGRSAGTGTEAKTVEGDVSVRRSGTNYKLKEGMPIQAGDVILVGRSASCTIVTEGLLSAVLDSNSVVQITGLTAEDTALEVTEGAVFFETDKAAVGKKASVQSGETEVLPKPGCVFSVEAYSGTWNVNVYGGEAGCVFEGETKPLAAGGHASAIREKGETLFFLKDITYQELRDFFLLKLVERGGLCFEKDELQAVLDSRREVTTGRSGIAERMTCTVQISCENACGKPEAAGLSLPEDGIILPDTTVKFSRGESVFDILERVCKNSGIEMDYDYSVAYEGFYVFEMAGLSENDFGSASGWLYSINGWYPNFGSSRYEVREGDVISWVYTCDGGADVGRGDWMDYRPE